MTHTVNPADRIGLTATGQFDDTIFWLAQIEDQFRGWAHKGQCPGMHSLIEQQDWHMRLLSRTSAMPYRMVVVGADSVRIPAWQTKDATATADEADFMLHIAYISEAISTAVSMFERVIPAERSVLLKQADQLGKTRRWLRQRNPPADPPVKS